jgi:hypothetical protein
MICPDVEGIEEAVRQDERRRMAIALPAANWELVALLRYIHYLEPIALAGIAYAQEQSPGKLVELVEKVREG